MSDFKAETFQPPQHARGLPKEARRLTADLVTATARHLLHRGVWPKWACDLGRVGMLDRWRETAPPTLALLRELGLPTGSNWQAVADRLNELKNTRH